MVMKLYGQGNICNTQRAILPLFEAEVDVEKELELVMVSLANGDQLKPVYTGKQPFAQIPYFEDGDFALFESRAITRYLAEKYSGQGTSLLGQTIKERGIIDQWIESEAHNLYPTVRYMIKEIYIADAMKRARDEKLIAQYTRELEQVLDVYEAYLAKNKRKYLARDTFSLADLCHTPYLYQVKLHKGEVLEGRPHVAEYIDHITARPAFQKLLQLDWDSATPLHLI